MLWKLTEVYGYLWYFMETDRSLQKFTEVVYRSRQQVALGDTHQIGTFTSKTEPFRAPTSCVQLRGPLGWNGGLQSTYKKYILFSKVNTMIESDIKNTIFS